MCPLLVSVLAVVATLLVTISDQWEALFLTANQSGDDVRVVLELLGDAAPEDDQEAEHHPGPLGQEDAAAAEGRAGEPPGGRRHLLRRDGPQVGVTSNNFPLFLIIRMCNFRRDIVFPGEIFPDANSNSSPDWDTIDTSHQEKVGKNNKNDGKHGVMTRWWSVRFHHSLCYLYVIHMR